ncbi:MAG TPA: CPBP family glutamic-type intramembrane protease [Phycisphaerae bacterium]|nr:CPBP family glutamic-type intramembrane protease [Phycisphaerae bacterium]
MVSRQATRKAPKTQTKRHRKKRELLSDNYWDVTHRPLQCLVFLLPLVLAYEIGMALLHGQTPIEEQPGLAARQLLQWFFSLFGVKGLYLPGIAVVVVLLIWQIVSDYPWRFSWHYLVGMAGESILLAMPLLLLNELIRRSSALSGVLVPGTSAFDNLLLSVGAGIYEELVFRLIIVTLLTVLLIDIGGLKQTPGIALTVILSSLMFAAHHYAPVGADGWSSSEFAFRAAAGAYLAAVFVVRGFGLAVGCHVFYDIIAFAMP